MEYIENLRKIVTPYMAEYPISYAGLFGSRARGDANQASDIDILIRYKTPIDLFDLACITQKIETATGSRVDLVIENTLHPLMLKYIKKDLKTLYE